MKIAGSYTIDAPREQVWAALNDIEVLARIVPGCERLKQTGENEYEGTVKIGIQTIKGSYSGRIRIEDIQPPHHYKLVASGSSASGVVNGSGNVDLAEQDGKTVLTYGGDAQIGGTLASVGQRLIESASRQMINQSLKALVEQIKLRAEQPKPSPEAPAEPVAPAQPPTESAAPAEAPAASAESAAPPAEEPGSPAATQTASEPPAPTAATGHDTPASNSPARSSASASFSASYPPGPSAEHRTVVVPEHEQLKPESVIHGIAADLLNERPWIPWMALAFVLGLLLGRRLR